jgi:hypothetical protein
MSLFDLDQIMGIFRAFRRDDTPEIANLKTEEAISPQSTPSHATRPKCLNVRFRHNGP